MLSFISFVSVIIFCVQFFVSLGKFIPRYLIFFVAMVNGIDSLISVSDFSLLPNKMSTSTYNSNEDLCPKESLSRPQSQGILQAQQVGLSQAPFKSLLLPCVPVHMRLCIVLQEWSLCFSQSYKNQDLMVFKCYGGSSFFWCQTPSG